tara:strand:+ start:251 stop:775 length:525 start_codon:yes stop_codon:yes gene_type:complete
MKNFILTIIATIALISCNNTKEKEAQVNENEPKEEVKTNKKPVDSMKIRYADAGLNKQYLENIQKSNKRAAIEEVYNWEELKILNDDILALEENRSLEPTVIEQLNQDAEAVRNSVPTLVSTSKVEDAILEIQTKIDKLAEKSEAKRTSEQVKEHIDEVVTAYDSLTMRINRTF